MALYSLNEEPDSKERKEAFNLAVSAGDHFSIKKGHEDFPQAEKFYQLAKDWCPEEDKAGSEGLYDKLLKILGAQGKSMEAIRQAVKHILETSVKTGDVELGQKQLLTIVDLAEQKFNA